MLPLLVVIVAYWKQTKIVTSTILKVGRVAMASSTNDGEQKLLLLEDSREKDPVSVPSEVGLGLVTAAIFVAGQMAGAGVTALPSVALNTSTLSKCIRYNRIP